MFFSTPNQSAPVSTVLSHFGGSDKAIAKKLWVTVGSVQRWRREGRLPPSLVIRWKRETGQPLPEIYQGDTSPQNT